MLNISVWVEKLLFKLSIIIFTVGSDVSTSSKVTASQVLKDSRVSFILLLVLHGGVLYSFINPILAPELKEKVN